MSWFPVDDLFHGHPKAQKAGDEAIGMWARAGSYCMAYLTDGFVPEWWVKQQPRGAVKAKKLVDATLWERGEKDGERGYQFHDWPEFCTKAHVLDVREKARQRKARSRESQQTSRVTDAVSPATCLVPTQPNPTQPINPVVNLGGEGTSVAAPPMTCPRHPFGTEQPCGACATARRQREAWDDGEGRRDRDQLDERRRQRAAAIAACPDCDANGLIETPAGMARCDHQAAEAL